MADNKTNATEQSVDAYLAAIGDGARREDCVALCDLMARASRHPPKMWGTSIVGFGSYHYRYESGREGDMCLVGFASRKGDISVYGLNAAPDHDRLVGAIGKVKHGKGCLYIKRLADLDLMVLEKLVAEAVQARRGAGA